jgi:hypothetical protein
LISGDSLIDISPPNGVDIVGKWGAIEEALAGAPIFCAIPNVTRGLSLGAKLLEGTAAAEGFRSALVHGSQTIWERDMIKIAFLWRTTRDVDFVMQAKAL